ncbi:MAG: hypothetical protein E6Q97_16315 [Desulfurellales bacterium]|nr:MAG: hypothetical protein E6Q97_16315 [Desulfurellales bacterium]
MTMTYEQAKAIVEHGESQSMLSDFERWRAKAERLRGDWDSFSAAHLWACAFLEGYHSRNAEVKRLRAELKELLEWKHGQKEAHPTERRYKKWGRKRRG